MSAALIQKERIELGNNRFVEVVIWALPVPLPGSAHRFKYRLALVVDNVCVLRYDNEAGKGDHKHLFALELLYAFQDMKRLIDDFWADVSEMGGDLSWQP
jgi:hypothetical protein